MPQRPLSVILLVVVTMASVTLIYAVTLSIIAVHAANEAISKLALEYFKDFAIYAAGALSGFLAKVSTHDSAAAQDVKITNPPDDPANVKEQK